MKKKTKLLNKEEIVNVIDIFENKYKDAICGLNFESSYELLISLILAAQCTDERVNTISPILIKKYPSFFELSKASVSDIFNIVKSCSFPNNKSKHILGAAKYIVENHQGIVPNTMEELILIPGIGRKSANILLADSFNIPVGIAVDTHVKRLSYRIGFTKNTDVKLIEKDLMKKVPKRLYGKINHFFVNHGKSTCKAIKPKCDDCIIKDICKKNV